MFILLPILFLLGCGAFRATDFIGNSAQGLCAHLSWTAPTANTDGSALTNLAGFKAYWGTSSHNYTQSAVIANAGATTYTICNLSSIAYYFAVTAYTTTNLESAYSSEVAFTPGVGVSTLKDVFINLSTGKISFIHP